MSDMSITPTAATPAVAERTIAFGGDTAPVATLTISEPSKFFVSPKGTLDPKTGFFVIQFRDGKTGEVLMQYPSDKVTTEYRKTQKSEDPHAGETTPSRTSAPVPDPLDAWAAED